LGQGPGTAGTLLQGGPGKQQMNYTSYEGGFQGSRGNSAIGQGGPQQSNMVVKSTRLLPNDFNQQNIRIAGNNGANSSLLKPH